MSTLNATNLKNPSSGSNNIVLGTDGATTLGTAKVTAIADSAGANSSTPAAIANGTCKAWVNFNGTSTVAIRASYNVSSITDNGTGDYTVNFTTAMADANYSVIGTSNNSSDSASNTGYGASVSIRSAAAPTTSAVRVYTINLAASSTASQIVTAVDQAYMNIAIFR